MPPRLPVWLPYLKTVNESPGGVIHFEYKGGEEKLKLADISCIMIYGETDMNFKLPVFEKITRAGIPIIYARRNIANPMVIHGALRHDSSDTITAQILARENEKKKVHIARQLLTTKMESMKYLVPVMELPTHTDVSTLRTIEAVHAKKYWEQYYERIGHPEWSRRGVETGKNPASSALDAGSRFISGIVLRWILYHHLSPSHGFFHVPTDYQSLVYDLMEPYRGIFEFEMMRVFVKYPAHKEKWIPLAINALKDKYNSRCYVPLTRQIVTYHELLHGSVLSLKAYLMGNQRKFHIPLPGEPRGGRPPKVAFKLYGRQAGKSNFWNEAYEVNAKVQERKSWFIDADKGKGNVDTL
ncbi:MAG: CRISPR-associated endonuclease Cas1 [Coriobacteriia bacterium]|nr:CRISPR-associated endonuclease Cas1 [Coriobacteriia bacterium]